MGILIHKEEEKLNAYANKALKRVPEYLYT